MLSLTAVCAVAVTVAGCGSGSKDNGSDTTAGATPAAQRDLAQYLKPPALPNWPVVPRAPPKNVSLIYLGGGSGTADLISGALQQATQALGWTYRRVTINSADPAADNSAVLSAINAGAKVIVHGSNDAAVREGAAEAAKAGVKLIQLNATQPDVPNFTATIGSTSVSAREWGKIVGLAVVADAERRGQTAHLALVSSSALPNFNPILDATAATVKQYCPKCTADKIDVPPGDLTTGQVGKSVVSFVQRKPDTNYVQFTVGFLSQGVRQALNGAGLGKVRFAGIVPTPTELTALKQNGDVGWVAYPSRLDAYRAVDAAVRALTGGDPTIHNHEPEPAWLLTPSSQFDPSAFPELPVDYRSAFSKLWRVASAAGR